MKTQEAKTYIQAALNGLENLSIRASKDNVGYLAGVYQILEEVKEQIDHLEPDVK